MSLLRRSFANLNRFSTRCIASSSRLPESRHGKPQWTSNADKTKTNGTANEKYEGRQTPAEYLKHRERMKELYPDGWNPPRKLSREAMDGLRTLHKHDPQTFSTPILAERFRISPEAVRRILRSKWMPSKEEKAEMLLKDRRRKGEYIARRIERERADKWEQLDSYEKPKAPRRAKDDGFSLV